MWHFIFLSFILILITILRSKNSRRRILSYKIPGPNGSFIIGMLPYLLKGPEHILKEGEEIYRKYDRSTYRLWILNKLYIVLTNPDDIESVLTNPNLQEKSQDYRVLQESIMGQGIFSTNNINNWKRNRKMVSAGFNFKILKMFISIFNEEANVLNDILQKKCNSELKECEIHTHISMATMEMIGRTAMGVKFNAQKNGCNQFVKNLLTIMFTWEYRITHPWYISKTLFQFSSVYRQHKKCQKIINEFTDNIINKKFEELNQKSNKEQKSETEDNDGYKKPKTLIEILLEHYNGMSHKQIRDELITIMIGGQETTAMANACTLFMLAHNQDIQNNVFEELQLIFSIGNPNRQPTYEDLQQMEYLERVIKETLRLFPPLPFIGRSIDKEIKIGKHICPAGSSLMILPKYLHSSPYHYTNPKRFNPDNFLPENCRSRHPYSYLPFSAGYRNCIGIKYGMLQMKTVISTIIRNNKLFPSDKFPTPDHLKLMFLVTLKFINGCHIKIEPRT